MRSRKAHHCLGPSSRSQGGGEVEPSEVVRPPEDQIECSSRKRRECMEGWIRTKSRGDRETSQANAKGRQDRSEWHRDGVGGDQAVWGTLPLRSRALEASGRPGS